jgi:hypothetical protein
MSINLEIKKEKKGVTFFFLKKKNKIRSITRKKKTNLPPNVGECHSHHENHIAVSCA